MFEFRLDPATAPHNPFITQYYCTWADNGLDKDWELVNAFINPQYSKVEKWVTKVHEQFLINVKKNPELVMVMLVGFRTDTKWFYEIVLPSEEKGYCHIEFIIGRLKFRNTKNSNPFPSILIIFRLNLRHRIRLKQNKIHRWQTKTIQ